MAVQKTLAILKPDAVEKGIIGELITRIDAANLKIVGMKMLQLTLPRAQGFYAVHKDRPFFKDLCAFMCSGPVVVMALEGDDAINKWRKLMGATDPEKAEVGTLRRDYGTNIERNATHGSDSPETAAFEVSYFFENNDIVKYEWL